MSGVSKKLQSSLHWFIFGYFVEHLANILLIYKIYKQKSTFGVSIDSQVLLLVATLSRCVWLTDT